MQSARHDCTRQNWRQSRSAALTKRERPAAWAFSRAETDNDEPPASRHFLLATGYVLPRQMSVFLPLIPNYIDTYEAAQMVRDASQKSGKQRDAHWIGSCRVGGVHQNLCCTLEQGLSWGCRPQLSLEPLTPSRVRGTAVLARPHGDGCAAVRPRPLLGRYSACQAEKRMRVGVFQSNLSYGA
jgi:hypothetical protein